VSTPSPVTDLLTAARLMAQSDRVAGDALRRAEDAIKLLTEIAKDERSTPERSMAAGMALAVVQHTASKAADTHTNRCVESIRESLK